MVRGDLLASSAVQDGAAWCGLVRCTAYCDDDARVGGVATGTLNDLSVRRYRPRPRIHQSSSPCTRRSSWRGTFRCMVLVWDTVLVRGGGGGGGGGEAGCWSYH